MQINKEQIKIVTGEKCPECDGERVIPNLKVKNEFDNCKSCKGTGLPTIEIKKERVEKKVRFTNANGKSCYRTEKIQKHQVGGDIYCDVTDGEIYSKQEFEVLKTAVEKHQLDTILPLKIISETETHWRLQRCQ